MEETIRICKTCGDAIKEQSWYSVPVDQGDQTVYEHHHVICYFRRNAENFKKEQEDAIPNA